MRDAPLKAIQELLGHATIQMTMRYAHRARSREGCSFRWQRGGSVGEKLI